MVTKHTPIIYSTKLTPEQNEALARYEAVTGIAPFGIEDYELGALTAQQLWQQNVQWLEGVLASVVNIRFPVAVVGSNSTSAN